MRKFVSLVLVSLLSTASLAQSSPDKPTSNSPSAPVAQKPDVPQLHGFGLEDGTPVKLRISRTMSSADAKVGETVDFEVLEEVRVGSTVVIPKGGIAWGTVTEAQSKRRMGRGGKFDMNIDSVRLVNGEKVALRAVKDLRGGGHVGAMTGAIVATSLVFFPAAPLFLFMHGKDITIPKGTEVTAYINGNTPLEEAQFLPKDKQKSAPELATLRGGSLEISSTPAGAEIEIDGNFSGNTPSTMTVEPGQHSVKITKKGFQPWQKTISITSGSFKLTPELEPDAKAN